MDGSLFKAVFSFPLLTPFLFLLEYPQVLKKLHMLKKEQYMKQPNIEKLAARERQIVEAVYRL